ncbi:MAG: type II toxin-antitoxin system RelE/ParE family toxin [Rhizomicrobium sp.]
MRIFKTKWFVRYARRERIADAALLEAIGRAEKGLVDADIGGGLIKQRIARPGRGRSGGYRVLIAVCWEDRAIFLYGFAKSERDNIKDDELEFLKKVGAGWLAADSSGLERAIEIDELQEI